MVDRLAELGALQYAAANTATASVNPSRIAASGYIHAMYAEYVTWSLANPGVNPSRLSAKGRIFGYFYDNATFSPLSLFAASEVGAWFDPSDFSTMFQDSAGTIPVTGDGQPVGKILDKSGRGNHATQATAASRPLYKTDGTYHWLQFDGVDDSLSTAEINFTATDKMSGWVGIYNSSTLVKIIVELSTGAASSGSFYIVSGNDSGFDSYSFQAHGSGASTGAETVGINGFIAPDKAVLTFTGNISASKQNYIRRNVGAYNTKTTGIAAGTFGNYPIYVGARAGTSLYFNGKVYSIIVRGALSTAQEITDTETWVNGKTGAY